MYTYYSDPGARTIARTAFLHWHLSLSDPRTFVAVWDYDTVLAMEAAATDLCLRMRSRAPPGAVYFTNSARIVDDCVQEALQDARAALLKSGKEHICDMHCPLCRLSWVLQDFTLSRRWPLNANVIAGWRLLGEWFVNMREDDPHAAPALRSRVAGMLAAIVDCWSSHLMQDVSILFHLARDGIVEALPIYCMYAVQVSSQEVVEACHIALSDTDWARAHGLCGVYGLTALNPLHVHTGQAREGDEPWGMMRTMKVSSLFARWETTAATAATAATDTDADIQQVLQAVIRVFMAGPGNDVELAVLLFPWVREHCVWKSKFAEAIVAKVSTCRHPELKAVRQWAKQVIGDCPPCATRWSPLRAAWCGVCIRSTLQTWVPVVKPPWVIVHCSNRKCCPHA